MAIRPGGFLQERIHGPANEFCQFSPIFQVRQQVDLLAMEADHLRVVVGDFESEMLDITTRSSDRIWCLHQNIRSKAVGHGTLRPKA
jgi:hypothetical protein